MRDVMLGDAVWPGFCEKTCGQCRCAVAACISNHLESEELDYGAMQRA